MADIIDLFREEFDPDGEFSVVGALSSDMEAEWFEMTGLIEQLWEATSERDLLDRLRVIKDKVRDWPG